MKEALFTTDGFIGIASYADNGYGKIEMVGFKPARLALAKILIPYLAKLQEKYPFIAYEERPDVDPIEAVRVYHKDFPETVYGIYVSQKPAYETILGDKIQSKEKDYIVEYWDQWEGDNDHVLHRCYSAEDAARRAAQEVLLTDLDNTDIMPNQDF